MRKLFRFCDKVDAKALQYARQMVRIPESSVKKYLDSHRAGQL